jgi:hypothetical protein
MQTVQSSLVPIQLSSDNGATFKDVVCLTSYDIPLNTPSTSVSTFCGQAVGLGNIAFNPKFSAVCDSAPDADTVSYADVLAWQIAKTKLRFRVDYPGQGSSSKVPLSTSKGIAVSLIPISKLRWMMFSSSMSRSPEKVNCKQHRNECTC